MPTRLVSSLLVLTPLLLASCAQRAGFPERPNILLVTIDTLRADHLSSYGYVRPTSPVIDRLAAEGVRFDQAAVQWPKTGPSFASIFTATYPKDNGIVRKIGIPVPLEYRTLAEELRGLGYTTHAVVANGAAGSDFNFDQGFDTYIETWKLPPTDKLPDPNRADGVTALALALTGRIDRDKPFFLWVHYLDPHFPYTPPEPWSDMFQDDEHYQPLRELEVDPKAKKRDLVGIGYGQVLDGRTDLGFYVARYDAEIAFNDHHLGELLAGLERDGWLDNTLTVLTSDHGESLGEHYYMFDHGRFSFQTCLRVPLIFHFPGVLSPAVVKEPVELIGLAPTLLEAAGLPLEEGRWAQGRSLAAELLRPEAPDRPRRPYAFSEAGYGVDGRWQRIVRTERYKLVEAREGGAQRWVTGEPGKPYALFDLESDPGETENLYDRLPDEAERLKAVLERWKAAGFDPRRDDPSQVEEREMDPETRRQLKALGYLQ
ncbi:MAG: sulfatase [Thermoanaerobaculia bacterium]|nr:sulfatase [Thermoanaerobaculia bacterium]